MEGSTNKEDAASSDGSNSVPQEGCEEVAQMVVQEEDLRNQEEQKNIEKEEGTTEIKTKRRSNLRLVEPSSVEDKDSQMDDADTGALAGIPLSTMSRRKKKNEALQLASGENQMAGNEHPGPVNTSVSRLNESRAEQQQFVASPENTRAMPTIGAMAVGPGGTMIPRARDMSDNVTVASLLDSIEYPTADDALLPPLSLRSSNDGTNTTGGALIEAQLAEEADQEVARLEEDLAHLRRTIATTEVARVVETEPQRRRKRFYLLGGALIVLVAAVGISVGVALSATGGDNSDDDDDMEPSLNTTLKQVNGLTMVLRGVESNLDAQGSLLWASTTKTYIEDFYNNNNNNGDGQSLTPIPGSRRHIDQEFPILQNVLTNLILAENSLVKDGNGMNTLQLVYSQSIEYAVVGGDNEDVSIESLVTEPFNTLSRRSAYINSLQAAAQDTNTTILEKLVGVSPVLTPVGSWQQVGQVVHGDASFDYFGVFVDMSRDGTVMAIGASEWRSETSPGYVRVVRYTQDTKQWVPMGQVLMGRGAGDTFGESVSLNDNGTILAVGGPRHENVGHVLLYEYKVDTDRWIQLGTDLVGKNAGDLFGFSVSLSGTGDRVAVGSRSADTSNGKNSGSVTVFQYDRGGSSLWNQVGQTLDGESSGDRFGTSVSLNRAGSILAIGANGKDDGGDDAGQATMLQYDASSSLWKRLGSPFNGLGAGDKAGISVSLDDTGFTVAVGTNRGNTLVLDYDSLTKTWNQARGQVPPTQLSGQGSFGDTVSLSGNGNTVTVGRVGFEVNGINDAGQVSIFKFNLEEKQWLPLGDPINGEAQLFGYSVCLSMDGTRVAVGASWHDVNGDRSGSAFVFSLSE